jgi:ribosomal protein L37E
MIIDEISWIDNHISIKDGGDPVIIDCPECIEHAFVVNEMQCAICESTQKRECDRCGIPIPPEELDGSGFCGYCNHMMSKDD